MSWPGPPLNSYLLAAIATTHSLIMSWPGPPLNSYLLAAIATALCCFIRYIMCSMLLLLLLLLLFVIIYHCDCFCIYNYIAFVCNVQIMYVHVLSCKHVIVHHFQDSGKLFVFWSSLYIYLFLLLRFHLYDNYVIIL